MNLAAMDNIHVRRRSDAMVTEASVHGREGLYVQLKVAHVVVHSFTVGKLSP